MSENTIGKSIGVTEHTLSITNEHDEKVTIKVKFDYSTTSNADIIAWLNANRAIAFQRPARKLSVEEIKSLDGSTIEAKSAGRKVQSREEKVQNLINAGMPRKLAEFSIDNPQAFEQVVNNIKTK